MFTVLFKGTFVNSGVTSNETSLIEQFFGYRMNTVYGFKLHCQWVQEIGQELANAIMRCVSSVNDRTKWWQNIELFMDCLHIWLICCTFIADDDMIQLSKYSNIKSYFSWILNFKIWKMLFSVFVFFYFTW